MRLIVFTVKVVVGVFIWFYHVCGLKLRFVLRVFGWLVLLLFCWLLVL